MLVPDDKRLSPPDGEEEFRLRPPEGPSREEISRQLEPPPSCSPAMPTPARPLQFSVGDVMVAMAGLSVGLAGGTWVPGEIFAAAMGIVMICGLLVVHLYPPESQTAKRLWWALGVAYTAAVLSAIVKSGH